MADKRPASTIEGAPPANKCSMCSRLDLDKADPSQGFHSQTLEEIDRDALALGQKFEDHVKKAAGLEILMGVTEELHSCVETFKAKGEESISAVKSCLDIIVKALKAPNGKGTGDEKHEGTKGDMGPGEAGPTKEDEKHKGTKGEKGPGKEQPTLVGEKDPTNDRASCSSDI
jgi:hypothetical protein